MRRFLSLFLIISLLTLLFRSLALADYGFNSAMDIKKDPLINVTNPGSSFDVTTAGSAGLPLGSFTVDPMSGAANYSYPLQLAPGRNGLTPALSIAYNSQNKNNFSPVGYGWDVPQGFIQ